MSMKLSRQELYDLVWSKPITHASKELGISDVMLGRICRERHVPCPPRGYWAKLSSAKLSKKPTQIPLPDLPAPTKNFDWCIKEEYRQREEARTDKFDPYDLDDPVKDPPKEFTESFEDFEKRVQKWLPKFSDPLSIPYRHPIVQKMFDADQILAAAYKRHKYYSDKPKYQDEKGQVELQMLNGLIHNFEACGFKVSLQGRKHFRHSVSICGHYKEYSVWLDLNEPDYFFRIRQTKEKKGKKYCFRWDNSYDSRGRLNQGYRFDKFDKAAVRQVIMDLVMKDERDYRIHVFQSYQSALESRKRAILENERRIREEAERKRRELEALLASRTDLIESAVVNIEKAERVRELVSTMLAKAKNRDREVIGLDHWVSWAAHYANTIDPRNMSLETMESWISKFKLKD